VDGSFYTLGQLIRVRLGKLEMEVSSYGHTVFSRFVLCGRASRASGVDKVPSPAAADTFQAWERVPTVGKDSPLARSTGLVRTAACVLGVVRLCIIKP
jgi:hypothetical protein